MHRMKEAVRARCNGLLALVAQVSDATGRPLDDNGNGNRNNNGNGNRNGDSAGKVPTGEPTSRQRRNRRRRRKRAPRSVDHAR